MRLAGVAFLPALIACYLLLSLPYLNVHAVLAGYADIWVAAVFCLAVCALYQWQTARHWGYAALWCLMAAFCSQLKNPGAVLALIVLFCGLRLWLNLKPALELALWAIAAVLAAWLLLAGFNLQVPVLGHLAFEKGIIEIGIFGQFELTYHPVGDAFAKTFFVMINWHLLWYLLLPCVCLPCWRLSSPDMVLRSRLSASWRWLPWVPDGLWVLPVLRWLVGIFRLLLERHHWCGYLLSGYWSRLLQPGGSCNFRPRSR